LRATVGEDRPRYECLVRYLTWDNEGQAIEAANAIERANAIVVPTIVLCELVWVLKRAYRSTGQEIIDILRRLVAIRAVEVERPAAGISMLEAILPMASSGTRLTVPNAIASSHTTKVLHDLSIPISLRSWELDPHRDQRASTNFGDRQYSQRKAPSIGSAFSRRPPGMSCGPVWWDNRCVVHLSDPFDPSTRRLIHRIQPKGTRPV
jgi:PIN domain-containing protein